MTDEADRVDTINEEPFNVDTNVLPIYSVDVFIVLPMIFENLCSQINIDVLFNVEVNNVE